jgi:hypothetical protein
VKAKNPIEMLSEADLEESILDPGRPAVHSLFILFTKGSKEAKV